MATITKRDLIVQITNTTGLTQNQVTRVFEEALEVISRQLANNHEVVLRNFGTFEVCVTKPKIGRNPNQPERAVPIPARTVVKFRPGKELKERVAQVLPQLSR